MKPELLLATALRDGTAPWPPDVPLTFASDLLDAADDHGVMELLSMAPAVRNWPDNVESAVLQRRREAAAAEIIRQSELAEVLSALKASGLNVLLLKGSGIAYTHYPQPWLRPRLDTDLLVELGDRSRAVATLDSLGYQPANHFGGQLVTYQSQFRRADRHGFVHRLDLHWKASNPQVFADALPFRELDRDAVLIPQLGAGARTLSAAHALLLACIHRVAHHANSDRLIWLYDIRLLVDGMSPDMLEHAALLAASKNLRSVCANGVGRSLELVGSGIPRPGIDRLLQPDGDGEATTEFLRKDRAKVDELLSDLHALQGWGPRLRLIREHLLPPAAYMRQAYGFSNPILLPFAYAFRAVTGAGKWFRPQR